MNTKHTAFSGSRMESRSRSYSFSLKNIFRASTRSTRSASSVEPPEKHFRGADTDERFLPQETDFDATSYCPSDLDSMDHESSDTMSVVSYSSKKRPPSLAGERDEMISEASYYSKERPPSLGGGSNDNISLASHYSKERPPSLSGGGNDTISLASHYSKERPPSLGGEREEMISVASHYSKERPPSLGGERPPSPAFSYPSMHTNPSVQLSSPMTGAPRPEPQYAGPDDVACSLCEGQKLRACKSCLTCVRSFCEMHVRDHYVREIMFTHQMVEVTEDLNIYIENAKLKLMVTMVREENNALMKEVNALKQKRTTPQLPEYICKGKTPTAVDVILDRTTAHSALVLSSDGKRVRLGVKSQNPRGPNCFDRWHCVIATHGFNSGRQYWEVEVNKEFTIGVMKASAVRKGHFNFGPSQGYWCVFHYWLSFSALSEPVTRLPIKGVPRTLGVCVDVDEKWVTFYNVETRDCIYTFKNMKLEAGEQVYPVFQTLDKAVALHIK